MSIVDRPELKPVEIPIDPNAIIQSDEDKMEQCKEGHNLAIDTLGSAYINSKKCERC